MSLLTDTSVEDLIEEIEKRPALYQKNLKEYSDIPLKKKLWEEVCALVVPNWFQLGPEERTKTEMDDTIVIMKPEEVKVEVLKTEEPDESLAHSCTTIKYEEEEFTRFPLIKTESEGSEEETEQRSVSEASILSLPSAYESENVEDSPQKALQVGNCNTLFDISSPAPFACDFCKEIFTDFSDFKKHKDSHKVDWRFPCKMCKKTFDHKSRLDIHMRKHTGERPYSCDTCQKSFNQKCHLTRHVRTHSGEKYHICSDCGKSFREPYALKKHQIIHARIKPETGVSNDCKLCNVTDCEHGPYTCNICHKSFTHEKSLRRHKPVHSTELFPTCQVCGKLYLTSSLMKIHRRSQTEEQTLICDKCEKSMAQIS